MQSLAETVQLTATVQDQNGRAMSGVAVTWISGDQSVATVNTDGLVTAWGNGATAVEASVEGLAGSAAITVEQRVVDVLVSPEHGNLRALGATIPLSADAVDANGHLIEDVEWIWSSSDESVVTVDDAGVVTAVANGVATVDASADGRMGGAEITVEQRAVAVQVLPEEARLLELGETVHLSAEAADANGHLIEGAEFAWSSGDPSVVTVDAAGLVTAAGNGVAEVAAAVETVEGFATVRADLHRGVLLKIYEAMGGDDWKHNENWGTDTPIGSWQGVLVDTPGVVWMLLLGDNGLTGAIPPELAGLETLHFLYLPDNSITGSIPEELVYLPLYGLVVSGNRLSGPIPPELAYLRLLQALDLARNEFVGPIPPEIGNLKNLSSIDVSNNDLSGPIPPEIGNLENLGYLALSNNDLSGAIPSEFVNLRKLKQLRLGGNRLTGRIPPELGDLHTYLEYVDLSDNELTGEIPPELGRLRAFLEHLDLSHNPLTGPVPPEIGNIRFLKSLRIDNTDLSGRLPLELIGLPLEVFTWDETDLCAPDDEEFQEWLKSIPTTSGPDC